MSHGGADRAQSVAWGPEVVARPGSPSRFTGQEGPMAEHDVDKPADQTSAWAHFHLPLTLADIRAAEQHVLERQREKRRERLQDQAEHERLTLGQRVADGV